MQFYHTSSQSSFLPQSVINNLWGGSKNTCEVGNIKDIMVVTVSDGNAFIRAANINRPEVSANYKCVLINHGSI